MPRTGGDGNGVGGDGGDVNLSERVITSHHHRHDAEISIRADHGPVGIGNAHRVCAEVRGARTKQRVRTGGRTGNIRAIEAPLVGQCGSSAGLHSKGYRGGGQRALAEGLSCDKGSRRSGSETDLVQISGIAAETGRGILAVGPLERLHTCGEI